MAQLIQFIGAGTGIADTATSINVPYPGSIQVGDLILLQVTVRDTTYSPGVSGFTALYSGDSNGTGRMWTYYRIADGTESGTVNVYASGTACKMGRMYLFRGTDGATIEGAAFNSGTDASIEANPCTTTDVHRMCVSLIYVSDDNAVDSFTGETGGDWVEAIAEFTTTAGFDGCIQLQLAYLETAGTITGGLYTMSAADPWMVRSFAILAKYSWTYTGNIPLSLTPNSGHYGDYPLVGNLVVELQVAASYSSSLYLYDGSITLSLTPSAVVSGPPIWLLERGVSVFGGARAITEHGSMSLDSCVDESGVMTSLPKVSPVWQYQGAVVFSLMPAATYSYVATYIYQGDVGLQVQPSAVHFATYPNYQGTISIELIPFADVIAVVTWTYDGNVTVSLTPTATHFAQYPNYDGTVVTSLMPSASYLQEWPYQGAIGLSLLPTGTYYQEWIVQGTVLIEVILSAQYTQHFGWIGTVACQLLPQSQYIQDYGWTGTVVVSLTPESSYVFIGLFLWDGDILFSVTPSSINYADWVLEGQVLLTLMPSVVATHHWVYAGWGTVTLLPTGAYGQVWTFAGVVGIQVLPSAQYGQEFSWLMTAKLSLMPSVIVVQDFGYECTAIVTIRPTPSYVHESVWSGQIEILILSVPTYFYEPAKYEYEGYALLGIMPTAGYALESVYVGMATVELLVSSMYSPHYMFQGDALVTLIPAASVGQHFSYVGTGQVSLVLSCLVDHEYVYFGELVFFIKPECPRFVGDFVHAGQVFVELLLSQLSVNAYGQELFSPSLSIVLSDGRNGVVMDKNTTIEVLFQGGTKILLENCKSICEIECDGLVTMVIQGENFAEIVNEKNDAVIEQIFALAA